MAAQMNRTAVVALFLVAVVVAAASVPVASAYGCYDDCYQRCANGKTDDTCIAMCEEACGGADAEPPPRSSGLSLAPPRHPRHEIERPSISI